MPERAQLQILLGALDVGFCLAEVIRDAAGLPTDFHLIKVNPAFEAMTGLRGAGGRRAMQLAPHLAPGWAEAYARAPAGEAMRFEVGWPDNGRFFDVLVTPVQPSARLAVVLRDITDRRRGEHEREAARLQAERLLAEMNHRMMNTLAMITSIVRLEAQQAGHDAGPAAQALVRVQSRLAAVAVLYRALNKAAAVAEVQAAPYLEEVARAVAGAVSDDARVRLDVDVADLVLPTAQAAPLGLLVNELMTNALKYAFPEGRSGSIAVGLQPAADGWLQLTVADDGVGMAACDQGCDGGIGCLLIQAFAEQIGGSVARSGGAADTSVTVTFPGTQLRPVTAAAG